MVGFLRKLFGHQQAPQSTNDEIDLEKFYTDSEHPRHVFEQLITAAALPKRLLVIHGLGGVGKSTLLKMYKLACHKHHIPAALVVSEEAPSPVDILTGWKDDLNHNGITLPTFQKTLNHYRAIQAKVETEIKKAHQAAAQVAGTLSKTIAKTAINMAASAIPIVGPLVGAMGGESAEAFIDWLRNSLSKPDMDLYLDPAKRLDVDFLSDLARAAAQQRVVLMADTYEQMTALDDWMRELARRLPKNVLLVIAGRTVPSWDRAWQDWIGKAEIVELKEMTPDDIRILVHRYYAYIRSGDPDRKQVEAIVQFARGLPMVATTVVQLWVKYGLEDFQAVRSQVVADLVDRLLEGVPQDMRPAFEAAAVLRYFNVEALRALLENDNTEVLYTELRRWPFIRSRKEGMAVHDIMREMINEALCMRTPERFRMLHLRAATYYEIQLSKASASEHQRQDIERLYHLIQAGEEASAVLESHRTIETALGYYERFFAESIIALLDHYLQQEHSRYWLAYLRYQVVSMDPKIETQLTHIKIVTNLLPDSKIDPRLWALIVSALAEAPAESGISPDEHIKLLIKAMNSDLLSSEEKIQGYLRLGLLSRVTDLKKAHKYFLEALNSSRQQGDVFRQIQALHALGFNCLLSGDWSQAAEWAKEGIDLSRQVQGFKLPDVLQCLGWALTYKGNLSSALELIQEALELARQRQDEVLTIRLVRRVAEIYDRQRLWTLSNELYQRQIIRDEELGRIVSKATYRTLLGISYLKQSRYKDAQQSLLESLLNADLDILPITLNTLGRVCLKLGNLDEARGYFERSQLSSRDNSYHIAHSLLGLLELDFTSSILDNLPTKITQIKALSTEYGYNDHLALLNLTQGHMAWDGIIPEGDVGFDRALHYYQLSCFHALSFNRFLLDEVLSGGEEDSELEPFIQHCLERGEEGERMLIALREWWQSGNNDIGISRPNTISPIPEESIPLLEAERIARQREPGDGSPQKSVVEQINAALIMANARKRLSP